uniref:Uncharacterized protein n=2 Tax=Pinguiococcus pyrenoidosus TaxID=172671 RepID=A0A7R9U2U1_9STRA|mmetsp:Transcript_12842/g.47510  ORF Transcript_12842/g.47510 Transcript_12842/m.47510 type:complete len:638 (+) Transcript_12842:298-2211(+)
MLMSLFIGWMFRLRPMVLFGGLALGLVLPKALEATGVCASAMLAFCAQSCFTARKATASPRLAPPRSPTRSPRRAPMMPELQEDTIDLEAPKGEQSLWERCYACLLRKQVYSISVPSKDAKEKPRPKSMVPRWCSPKTAEVLNTYHPSVKKLAKRAIPWLPTSALSRMCISIILCIVVIDHEVDRPSVVDVSELSIPKTNVSMTAGHAGPMIAAGFPLPADSAQASAPTEPMARQAIVPAASSVDTEEMARREEDVKKREEAANKALEDALAAQQDLANQLKRTHEVHKQMEEERAAQEALAAKLVEDALSKQREAMENTVKKMEQVKQDTQEHLLNAQKIAESNAASAEAARLSAPVMVAPETNSAAPAIQASGQSAMGSAGGILTAPVTDTQDGSGDIIDVGQAALSLPLLPHQQVGTNPFLTVSVDGEKPVPPKTKCPNGCPFGASDKNIHIVWTTLQQAEATRGIMGGANLAEAKLRDFIALSVPSMALNYRNGWRGVWLVYYDDPTHAKYPAGYIERLTEALKELPFAAALPAAIKGSGGGQRYQFTGGGKCMQHTKQLRKAIKDGMFPEIRPPPTDKTYGVSKTVSMTHLEPGDAFATNYLGDIQRKAYNWDLEVKKGAAGDSSHAFTTLY